MPKQYTHTVTQKPKCNIFTVLTSNCATHPLKFYIVCVYWFLLHFRVFIHISCDLFHRKSPPPPLPLIKKHVKLSKNHHTQTLENFKGWEAQALVRTVKNVFLAIGVCNSTLTSIYILVKFNQSDNFNRTLKCFIARFLGREKLLSALWTAFSLKADWRMDAGISCLDLCITVLHFELFKLQWTCWKPYGKHWELNWTDLEPHGTGWEPYGKWWDIKLDIEDHDI